MYNRSSTELFDEQCLTNLNHWAVASILKSGEVLFIDSMYKNVPNNLLMVINDYYKVKNGRQMREIVNLAGQKNCPTQRDTTLCGLIALMMMVLLHHPLLTKMMMYTSYRWLIEDYTELIIFPSSFGQYLRRVFQTAYSVHDINIELFICKEGLNLLEVKDRFTTRDAQKFPLPQTRKSNFNNSSHDDVNSDGIGSSQRKAKGSINKSEIVIEDVSDHDYEFGQERATNDPSLFNRIDGNNSRDNKFENIGIPEEESESVSEKEVGLPDKCMESGANVLVDELNEEGNKNTKNVVLPHFVGDIEIEAMSKFDGCVDIDGYTWNRRRRRVNNAKKQNKFESYYQCNNCTATKIIIRKFDKSSKSITIRYLTPHSKPCTIPKNSTEKEKQSTQNVLKGGNEAEKEPSVEASVIDEQNEYSCAYDVMDDDLEKTIVEMENELEIGPQEAENAPEENISPNHLAGKNRNYGADESSKHRGESINISINPEDFFANANLTQDDSVNDNSLDNGKNNGGDEQREETIEVVIFKVRQKEKQLKLFKLKDDMERFCVEEIRRYHTNG